MNYLFFFTSFFQNLEKDERKGFKEMADQKESSVSKSLLKFRGRSQYFSGYYLHFCYTVDIGLSD